MQVTIVNQSPRTQLLRFNSGTARYLAPGEVMKGVEHVELKGNDRIRRLTEAHAIVLEPPLDKAGAGSRPRSRDMRAEDAIERIGELPVEELEQFLSADENRVTVLRAAEERRAG